MPFLNDRLTQLVAAIVKEYIQTAEPVGSKSLVEKHHLKVSAATVRNEMVKLTEQGFLEKPHFSAGRIPTPLAFRYFIKHVMEEESLPVVKEVTIKQRLWENRQDPPRMIRQAVKDLSEETQNLSLALIEDDLLHHTGAAFILNHPEFYNIDVTRTLLRLLDEPNLINSIFSRIPENKEEGILLGQELGLESLSTCGLVFARIRPTRNKQGYLAVLGPMRLNYPQLIPCIRYFRELINQLGQNL